MPKKEAMVKKERLTLSQLASYDDILTDALVDHAYFWTTIRKNRSKYQLTRGISEDDVTRILLYEIVVGKDVQQAEEDLLKLPGLRKFLDRLKTEREKEDFKRHMRKYISIWLPDCPFEVSTTNRYTIVTQEAATTARRFIKKGETIKYLCGNLVAMTSEEEKDLDLTRRDFSIVMSSRKKTPSLFLGPARFANHDCNANARLVTTGPDGMQVVAARNIEVDDEITVTYGEDYFGIGNCECLCRSCELEGRNGWANGMLVRKTSWTSTPITEGPDTLVGPYSFRKKRKYVPFGEASSGLATPDTGDLPAIKRRKSGTSELILASQLWEQCEDLLALVNVPASNDSPQQSIRQPFTEEPCSEEEVLLIPTEEDLKVSILGVSAETEHLNPDDELLLIPSANTGPDDITPLTPLKSQPFPEERSMLISTPMLNQTRSILLGTPQEMRKDPSQASHVSSDADSIFDRDQLRSSSPTSSPCRSEQGLKTWKLRGVQPEDIENTPPPNELAAPLDSESDLSELSSSEDFDDDNLRIMRKATPRSKKPKALATRKLAPPSSPVLETPKIRYPNDYIRTPLLLSEPFSRWVDCGTCNACWVQANGYYTRKECPRCERHSKLYGYQWPKTDKVKGEEVGRVMDHRTVHRFVRPEEEARISKRGKGLMGEVGMDSVGVGGGEESEDEEMPERERRSGRRRRAVDSF